MKIKVYDEIVELTQETILKTRQQKIDNCLRCIEEVASGEVYLNPEYGLERYKAAMLDDIEQIERGEHDHYLAFIQTAYYIQTGKCVGILG